MDDTIPEIYQHIRQQKPEYRRAFCLSQAIVLASEEKIDHTQITPLAEEFEKYLLNGETPNTRRSKIRPVDDPSE